MYTGTYFNGCITNSLAPQVFTTIACCLNLENSAWRPRYVLVLPLAAGALTTFTVQESVERVTYDSTMQKGIVMVTLANRQQQFSCHSLAPGTTVARGLFRMRPPALPR